MDKTCMKTKKKYFHSLKLHDFYHRNEKRVQESIIVQYQNFNIFYLWIMASVKVYLFIYLF